MDLKKNSMTKKKMENKPQRLEVFRYDLVYHLKKKTKRLRQRQWYKYGNGESLCRRFFFLTHQNCVNKNFPEETNQTKKNFFRIANTFSRNKHLFTNKYPCETGCKESSDRGCRPNATVPKRIFNSVLYSQLGAKREENTTRSANVYSTVATDAAAAAAAVVTGGCCYCCCCRWCYVYSIGKRLAFYETLRCDMREMRSGENFCLFTHTCVAHWWLAEHVQTRVRKTHRARARERASEQVCWNTWATATTSCCIDRGWKRIHSILCV